MKNCKYEKWWGRCRGKLYSWKRHKNGHIIRSTDQSNKERQSWYSFFDIFPGNVLLLLFSNFLGLLSLKYFIIKDNQNFTEEIAAFMRWFDFLRRLPS